MSLASAAHNRKLHNIDKADGDANRSRTLDVLKGFHV